MKESLNKVAIITGASAPKGIGRAIAKKLASQGFSVVVTDVDGMIDTPVGLQSKLLLLDDLASELKDLGGDGYALKVDVTRTPDIARCVELTIQKFGRIDVLVNNAGTTIGCGSFLSSSAENWNTSFKVNLLGPTLFSQTVIPEMQKVNGGSIINIGSTGSLGGEAGFAAYTTMKHGMVGLTKSIAAEFGPDGIRCNIVCPGYVGTDMHLAANLRLAEEQGISVDEIRRQRYASVALRRAGDPEEVAETVAFLASESSSYITGVTLPVSGGTPVGI